MLIYPALFIQSRFSELDSLLVKDTRKINLRRTSKWLRSLHLAMACESCGKGGGDSPCRCGGEVTGNVERPGLDAGPSSNVVQGPAPGAPCTLPSVSSFAPPGEVPVSFGRPRAAIPVDATPEGYRPSGPVWFGVQGLPPVSKHQVPVYRLGRRLLVDASGREYCGKGFGCEKPAVHTGRCGRWAVCTDCGIAYGSTHEQACSVRPSGSGLDKPPWMCARVPFCRKRQGHRGVHGWVPNTWD
jgi:hypothetical protein